MNLFNRQYRYCSIAELLLRQAYAVSFSSVFVVLVMYIKFKKKNTILG